SKEAVSSAGVWVGYFAFEKGTERFTTQDIRLSLGVDVKSGSIQLENYIAEFDNLKKQIDALQIAVDKADVVKRTGGTMTGNLEIANGKGVYFQDGSKASIYAFYQSNGDVIFRDVKNSNTVFGYSQGTKLFNVLADTNLLKKTGDTMSGNLDFPVGKAVGVWNIANKRAGYFWCSPSTGKVNFSSDVSGKNFMEYEPSTDTLLLDAKVLKTKNDTDWIPLTLLNGVKQQSSQPASAVKRSGNVVNIVCAITDFKDKQVIANVPAIFRPDREMLFTPNYFQGLALKTGYVIVKP
ncbi:hypothetical protein PDQ07_27740, partial [Bacillus cereus]|nr:hypothetical protein [Bacillus cereus]